MRTSTIASSIHTFLPCVTQHLSLHEATVPAYLQGTCWGTLPFVDRRKNLAAVGGVCRSP